MDKHGIKPSREILQQRQKAALFKHGQTSAMKGRKQSEWMSPEAIQRSIKYRFKKGQLPHNTKEEYAVSLRQPLGYIWFRRDKNKWEELHRFIYRVHHDVKLQPGDVVAFKDGNRNNLSIDNLILVSKRDLLDKNSIHRFPPEVKATIHTLARLKRLIKQKENEKQD